MICRCFGVISKYLVLSEKKLQEERKQIQDFNSEVIKYESSFWKDYNNWIMLILFSLLALIPISIAFI
jgi:hypothetical protein